MNSIRIGAVSAFFAGLLVNIVGGFLIYVLFHLLIGVVFGVITMTVSLSVYFIALQIEVIRGRTIENDFGTIGSMFTLLFLFTFPFVPDPALLLRIWAVMIIFLGIESHISRNKIQTGFKKAIEWIRKKILNWRDKWQKKEGQKDNID